MSDTAPTICQHPTPEQLSRYQRAYPQSECRDFCILDSFTCTYNCIAWAVGITSRDIWPWSLTSKVSLKQFDALFFEQFGFQRATRATVGRDGVAAFGKSTDDMKHVARLAIGHDGSLAWTSKLGCGERIEHWLVDLASEQSMYGWVQTFYSRAAGVDASVARARALATAATLSADEANEVARRATAVAYGLRAQFDASYQAWQATWMRSPAWASSAPVERTRSDEFRALVDLGPGIVPLLMARLLGDEAMALQAVERLIDPALVFRPRVSDPAVLGGEALRGRETVRRWLGAARS